MGRPSPEDVFMRTATRALLLALLVISPALAAPAPFVPPTKPRPTQPQVSSPFNPDSPVKDVIVNVRETSTGRLMFGLGVNSDAGFTGSIVLNERNFDINRSPGEASRTVPAQPQRPAARPRPPAPPSAEPPSR
jgi:hypothetical protein